MAFSFDCLKILLLVHMKVSHYTSKTERKNEEIKKVFFLVILKSYNKMIIIPGNLPQKL